MKWIKLEDQLPPKNTLVLVKRFENKAEKEPIYFAMRNNRELSQTVDASKDCFWFGTHVDSFTSENEKLTTIEMQANFSDVTVKEWAFIKLESL